MHIPHYSIGKRELQQVEMYRTSAPACDTKWFLTKNITTLLQVHYYKCTVVKKIT